MNNQQKRRLIITGAIFGLAAACIVGILSPILGKWTLDFGYDYLPPAELVFLVVGLVIGHWLLLGTLNGIAGGFLGFLLTKKESYHARFFFALLMSFIVGLASSPLLFYDVNLFSILIYSLNLLLFIASAFVLTFLSKQYYSEK